MHNWFFKHFVWTIIFSSIFNHLRQTEIATNSSCLDISHASPGIQNVLSAPTNSEMVLTMALEMDYYLKHGQHNRAQPIIPGDADETKWYL